MSESRIFEVLPSQASRHAITTAVANAPVGYLVKIGPATRSQIQSAKLHALFGDIAKTIKYNGRTLTANQWKSILISAHTVATGIPADFVIGIEGEIVNVRESSAQMSVSRMTSLIEYVMAYMAHQEVAA